MIGDVMREMCARPKATGRIVFVEAPAVLTALALIAPAVTVVATVRAVDHAVASLRMSTQRGWRR